MPFTSAQFQPQGVPMTDVDPDEVEDVPDDDDDEDPEAV